VDCAVKEFGQVIDLNLIGRGRYLQRYSACSQAEFQLEQIVSRILKSRPHKHAMSFGFGLIVPHHRNVL